MSLLGRPRCDQSHDLRSRAWGLASAASAVPLRSLANDEIEVLVSSRLIPHTVAFGVP